jgi:ribosomal protein L7/L12
MSIQVILEGREAEEFIAAKRLDVRMGMLDIFRAFEGQTPKNRIAIITGVRGITGWGLKESKAFVDEYFAYKG